MPTRKRRGRHLNARVNAQFHMAVVLSAAFAFALAYAAPVEAACSTTSSDTCLPILPALSVLTSFVFGTTLLASLWLRRNAKDSTFDQMSPSWMPAPRTNAMFPNTQALIVDHRLPDRQQLRQQLESLGVNVAEEGNGSRAADRALNTHFDVILMSPRLPIMEASVVRDVLRSSGVAAPIVLICASASEAEQEQVRTGVLTITRPIELQALRYLLQRALPRKVVELPLVRINRDLLAMEQALDSQDFDQLTAFVQNLRELGTAIGSSGLQASVERLEACLNEEKLQEPQLAQIRTMLEELGAMTGDFHAGEPERSEQAATNRAPK